MPPHNSAGLVDLHTHILPGVDDGARSMDEAVAMLRMAAADGTRIIVATPHSARVTPESLQAGMVGLRAAARDIGITILSGSEVKFSAGLADDYRAGKLIPIENSGYVLVEFPFSTQWTPLIHTSLSALQLAGAVPIVAHAERYPAVQDNPSILVDLARLGIPVQINAGSLLGEAGEEARRTAELLLRAGVMHLLASDGHRVDKRKPLLSEAYARVAELAGERRVHQLQINAIRVLQGRPVSAPEPDESLLRPPSRLRGLLGRVRG